MIDVWHACCSEQAWAFGRLRKIKNQSSVLVEEFTYNGLGHRIGWHYDVDADSDVDSSDAWFYFAYDDAWRLLGTFRSSDTNAKELFVAHMAGMRGLGFSSLRDEVILRDRDANTSWGSATDGTREERIYYCQNWRGDISTLLKATGGTNCSIAEVVRYSSYGVPFGIPKGDIDCDGDCDNDDNSNWPGSYTLRCDFDLDGDMDITDQNVTIAESGATLGRGNLSRFGNRKGYAGYEHDGVVDTLAHVRHRILNTELGRWNRRDPLGGVDGSNRLAYVESSPIALLDWTGASSCEDYGSGGWPSRRRPCRLIALGDDGDTAVRCPEERFVVGFEGAGGVFGQNHVLTLLQAPEIFDPTENIIKYYLDGEWGLAAEWIESVNENSFMCSCTSRKPVVVTIGWSLGAISALNFATRLSEHEIDVFLGFTFDPIPAPPAVPQRAMRWVNFWQTSDPILDGHPINGAINTRIYHYDGITEPNVGAHTLFFYDAYVLGVPRLHEVPLVQFDADPREPVMTGWNFDASPNNLWLEFTAIPTVAER